MRDEKQRILCVGGPRDGDLIAARGRMLCVPVRERLPAPYVGDFDPTDAVASKLDTYEIDRLNFSHGDPLYFWRHSSLTPRDAFARLFEHYRPSK